MRFHRFGKGMSPEDTATEICKCNSVCSRKETISLNRTDINDFLLVERYCFDSVIFTYSPRHDLFCFISEPIFHVLWIRLRNQTRHLAPFQIDRLSLSTSRASRDRPAGLARRRFRDSIAYHNVDSKKITALNQPFQVLSI